MLKGEQMNLKYSSLKMYYSNPKTFLGLGLDFGMQHSLIVWTDQMHSYVIEATL